MRAGQHADLDRDVAYLVLGTPVGALLVHGDALADDRLLELFEREQNRRAALLGALRLLPGGAFRRRRCERLERRRLDRLGGVLALELVLDLRRGIEVGGEARADLLEHRLVDVDRLELFLLPADALGELALRRADLLGLRLRAV